ncbi:MAG: chromate efflux transporter [Polyangiaceae bacterium]
MRGDESGPEKGSLTEVARLFLRLGFTALGGPAAHIAMMQNEVVERRKWLTSEEFLDLLGATHLIPGPNSTELAIHIGNQRAGFRGLLVAGACFIVPAAAISFALAWLYVRLGTVPQARGVLYGVKPVIIAVVLQALLGLGKTALKNRWYTFIGALCIAATLAGVGELVVLVGAGALVALLRDHGRPSAGAHRVVLPVALGTTAAVPATFSATKLFLVFLKIGSILFGSGYVLLAFLRADLVTRLHWLTEKQLMDAVAVGQLTPGPVFSTATFIGYVIGGGTGSVLATLGIFLPSFFFVAVSGRLIPYLRRSNHARAFLDGVNVASLALMTVVTGQLGRAAIVDATTGLLAIGSAILLLRFKLNSAWLVLGGGAVGFALENAFHVV